MPASIRLNRFRAAYSALLLAAEELRVELETEAGHFREAPAEIREIQGIVAAHYHLTVAHLVGRQRDQHTAFARQVAMALCRELVPQSMVVIAAAFGRDHGMVVYARRAIADWRSLKPRYEAEYGHLRAACLAALALLPA